MNKRCPGCGYRLQSDDATKLGYVPSNTKNNAKYCARCYKIIHYNDALIVDNPKETEELIDIVNKKAKYVFFLIDFLNINTETIATFKSVTALKCLVISKCDIIPKSVKENRVKDWLREEYEIVDEIIFTSSLKKFNIRKIPNMMEELDIKKAYVLGFTNSGKSSLINKIYETYQNKISAITTSVIPNTTMDFINLKIDSNLTLVDSPGFGSHSNIYEDDDIELVKRVNAKGFIKPITYQLKPMMSILMEDKFRFEYLSDANNSMTFYISNAIELDKIYEKNERFKNHKSKIFNLDDNTDIVIKGVGFINIKRPCQIKIYSKYLNLVEIRKSAF